MYAILHRILVVFYTLLPLAALGWAIAWGRYKRSLVPIASFLVTCLSGIILGTCVDVIFVALLHGSLSPIEVIRTWYFITAVLCAVSLFRWALRLAVMKLFALRPGLSRSFWTRVRFATASIVQLVILFGLGLPYVVGTLLVYRIHVNRYDTPQSVAQCEAERVTFLSTDRLPISAWWLPADPSIPSVVAYEDDWFGSNTVILCGGLTDDLTDEAGLMRLLVNDGYNVLVVNLRGHEASGGRWTSFGDLERRDILGAVRWLKQTHPEQAMKIKAIGIGIGGAAVIAAAADDSEEGQSIQAVAVFGTYARFEHLGRDIFAARLPPFLRKWATAVTLPIASMHAGSDLMQFAPADLVQRIWPRPLLVIQGRADHIFPPSEAEELFRQASYPKRAVWLESGHSEAMRSRKAARELLEFLNHVQPRAAI